MRSGALPNGLYYYVRRVFGYAGPLVTIDGRDDGQYIHATAEIADPTPEAITALAERLIADSRARRAGKRASPIEPPERSAAPVAEVTAPAIEQPEQGLLL